MGGPSWRSGIAKCGSLREPIRMLFFTTDKFSYLISNYITMQDKATSLVIQHDVRNPYLLWVHKNLLYSSIIHSIPLKERICPNLNASKEGNSVFVVIWMSLDTNTLKMTQKPLPPRFLLIFVATKRFKELIVFFFLRRITRVRSDLYLSTRNVYFLHFLWKRAT